MSETKIGDLHLRNQGSEFNDQKLQQFPLKLPRLTNPSKPKQSFAHKLKKFSLKLPKVNDPNFQNINSLDGSDMDQSQNYINSEDNMKQQIDQMKRKMNLSKYSEKFPPHPDSSQQKLREKHSGSSTYIKNNKILQEEAEEERKTPFKDQQKVKRLNRRHNKSVSSPKDDSDVSDFEQKVEANRAFIKNKIFMKKNKQGKEKSINKKTPLFDNPGVNQQLLYEKRVKDYKNQSENKYLNEKKKEVNDIGLLNMKIKKIQNFLKPRQKNRSAKQMTEQRKVISSINNNQAFTKNISADKSKKKRRKTKLKQKILDQSPNSYPVSQNLFADINIILGKKQKSRSQFLSVGKQSSLSLQTNLKSKKKPSLNIKQLQQSFRILQEQQSKLLGYKRQPENIKAIINKSLILPSNLLQWQRIAISDNKRHLNLIQSNFVNQVDRINDFHQKNQLCLQTYISNKELLIQMQIQQKLKRMSLNRNKLDISNNEDDKLTNK